MNGPDRIARANRYREARAHCLFVPSVADKTTIRTLVAEIHAMPYPEANRLFE